MKLCIYIHTLCDYYICVRVSICSMFSVYDVSAYISTLYVYIRQKVYTPLI